MSRVTTLALFACLPISAVSLKQAVIGSQHDLTVAGSGPVKSAEINPCVFCHAPHNIMPNVTPLWDHALSSQNYTTYTSSTYTSGAQTPGSGSSKLCLSCHDGTVAVGLTVTKGLIATSGAMTSADVLGANLSTSHPPGHDTGRRWLARHVAVRRDSHNQGPRREPRAGKSGMHHLSRSAHA